MHGKTSEVLPQFSFLYVVFFVIFLCACMPVQDEVQQEIKMDLEDVNLRRLLDYQDRQIMDSLLPYLSHSNPTYRYFAASAFGSYKDAKAADTLASMLGDPQVEVAIAAAYALGQIGQMESQDDLASAFKSDDSLKLYRQLNRTILEAIGKCGDEKYLDFLSTIKTYRTSDTTLLQGRAWGLYRFALRNMTTPDGTNTMVSYLVDPKIPESVQLIAANYLFRSKEINLDSFIVPLNQVIRRTKSPYIRMAVVSALGKTSESQGLETLFQLYDWETDYRVKCNILRTLERYPYIQVKPYVLKGINDSNPHVSYTAARTLINNGDPKEGYAYLETARAYNGFWRTKINLYHAALTNLPLFYLNSKRVISNELINLYNNTSNNYEKAEIIRALGAFPANYAFIKETGYASIAPPVRTAAVESLTDIVRNTDFQRFFRLNTPTILQEFKNHFLDAVSSHDVGMISVASGILADTTINWEMNETELALLSDAESTIKLPREVEALQALHLAMARFGLSPVIEEKTKGTHRINWNVLQGLSNDSRAVIHTNKGIAEMNLNVLDAPGTVANFVTLIKDGFFEGKVFHRVVPNFVIQGGCPRGDGYGNLDHTIRSELPMMHYDAEGYVGMASAGNHTESTQWFITHSPTPHLDGNYTIFGNVLKGMDVVHQIQVGDIIEKISIVP